MLLIRWGSYRHRISEGDLVIDRQPITNAKQVVTMIQETWSWTGRLRSQVPRADYRNLIPIIRELETAYSKNGLDLSLEHFNGTPTHHRLLNSDCLGGTRVVQFPTFPEGKNAENVNYRTYRVAVTGIRVLKAGGAFNYKSFTEQIQIRGGGRKWGLIEVNSGPAIRQQLRTHTICTATQSGSAVVTFGTPQVPPPIWPYALVDEYPDYTQQGPQTIGEGASAYPIDTSVSWTWNFAWSDRLFGTAHYLL